MNTDLEITLEFLDSPTEVEFYAVAGAPGQDGQDGAPGIDGADGHTPVITASKQGTVTTIFVDGDPVAQILDGDTGAKGDKGDKGDPGQDGAKGDKGDTGAKGDKGDKGDTGAQGIQGIQGEKGETGAKGDKGDTGATGAAGQDGYTPIRGTDYWTAADKAEIVEEAAEAVDLSDYVQKTDIATMDTAGIVRPSYFGVRINNDGQLYIQQASISSEVKPGTAHYLPIVPASQHAASFYGLAKAAGDATQSASSNTVGNYTDAAKVAIQKMLGIYEAPWELIRNDTGTNATESDILITVDNDGNTFELTDVFLIFHVSSEQGSEKRDYGRFRLYYGSGARDYNDIFVNGAMSAGQVAAVYIRQEKGAIFTQCIARSSIGTSGYIMARGDYRDDAYAMARPIEIFSGVRGYFKVNIISVTGGYTFQLYGKRRWQ